MSRFSPETNSDARLSTQLSCLGVDLVLDVGANTGQFGKYLRSIGYQGRILSFEPITSCHNKLEDIARRDSAWQVYQRCALGARPSRATLNISANTVSSSLLPMRPLHTEMAPNSIYVATEDVDVLPLSDINHPWLLASRSIFLKIDTQGYELPVLQGALPLLSRLLAIRCELSLEALYVGEATWKEVIDWLLEKGFAVYSIDNGFSDGRSGRQLQADFTFVRLPMTNSRARE